MQKIRTWFNNKASAERRKNPEGAGPQRKRGKAKAADGGQMMSDRDAVYDVFRKEITALALERLSKQSQGKQDQRTIETINGITQAPGRDATDPIFRQVRQVTTEFMKNITPEQQAMVDQYLVHVEEHGKATPLTKYTCAIVTHRIIAESIPQVADQHVREKNSEVCIGCQTNLWRTCGRDVLLSS